MSLQPGDPAQVGRYRLLARLGEGGMGQVFLGVSPSGRKVAVKMIHVRHAHDAEYRARFAREVAAAQRVSGFYTAPVVDADPDATPPWMVTAYIPGPTLYAAVADNGPLPPAETARLGAELAEGLAAIHKCGLIHRDLKPANILMADDGPRIIDFGIARVTGTGALTSQGTLLGTYAYMSPEQVRTEPVGEASDIFSLGSVLAYAASGHGPFDADNFAAIMHNIASQPPTLKGITGPLRTLIAACLQKEPARRPDLAGLLDGLTAIADAAPPPPPHPVPARRTGGSALDASGAMVLHLPSGDGAQPSQVAFSVEGRILLGCAAIGSGWRAYLWDTVSGQLATRPIDGQGSAPQRLAFSPNGRLLAITDHQSTNLRRVGTWQPALLPDDAATRWKAVAFSPDGYLLATIADARTGDFTGTLIRLWSAESLRATDRTFRLASLIDGSAVRFSPRDKFLLAGTGDDMFVCDLHAPLRSFQRLPGYNGLPGKAAFSGDGTLLAAENKTAADVSLLDIVSGRVIARLACDLRLSWLAFSPADRLLVTATGDQDHGAIDLWAVAGHPVRRRRLEGFGHPASILLFSPDGQFLAAASDTGQGSQQIRAWGAGSAQPCISAAVDGPATLAFSPDSRYLAVSCADQTARLWDMRMPSQPHILGEPIASPGRGRRTGKAMAFSPDSRLLAAADQDGARLWRLP